MNEESIYLLNILKAFVLNENPGTFHGDWSKLIHLAGIHSVTGILGYTVMNYPDESNAQVAGFMRKQCLQSIAVLSQRSGKMKNLIQLMNEQEIDHLIFKGYVLKDYYPIPELRTYGDIDLLIRLEDRQKSDALMMREGFARKTDWEPVYSYFRQAEYYEIHTDVMEVDVSDKADYKGYFQHIWEHAHQVDAHTYELSPEYHFLYLLTHIAKHISGSGAGIRMYMDIAVFIQHFDDSIDWKYIREELDKLKFREFANTVLMVVEKYFAVKSPIPLKEISEQVIEDFMKYTLEGGVFGHVKRDNGMISLKQEQRDSQEVSRASTLIHRLFPKASSLERRYTYLQNRHWLLPFAWLHRIVRTKSKWKAHMREAQSILSTETEEVLKLRRIYKEIGL